MISNERQWPHLRPQQRNRFAPRPQRPDYVMTRPTAQDTTLERRELQVERKQLILELKENSRGRFLRVTESVGGRSNAVIVPVAGLQGFQEMLADMLQASTSLPAKTEVVSEPVPS